MNRPIIRPYRSPDGSYVLHPAFVRGLIGQIVLQNYNNEQRDFDWETARNEIQCAMKAFEELAMADAQELGETIGTAQIQARGVLESFAAGIEDIQ